MRNPEVYQERAMENSIKSIPVLAPRGKILDRDGRVIVDNHSSFSLYLSRENLKMEHLRPIAEGPESGLRQPGGARTPVSIARRAAIRAHPDQGRADARRAGVRRIAQGCQHVPRAGGDSRAAPPVSARRPGRARHRVRRRNQRIGVEHAGVRALPSGRHHRQGRHRARVQRPPDGRGRPAARGSGQLRQRAPRPRTTRKPFPARICSSPSIWICRPWPS